jgi:hypothetical protein
VDPSEGGGAVGGADKAEVVEEGQMTAGERAPARRRLRKGAGLFGMLPASIAGLALFGALTWFFLSEYFLSNYPRHHGILDSGTISNVSNSRTDRGRLLFIFAVWRLAVIRFGNRRLPPPPAGRHRHQHGTPARSRVGGLRRDVPSSRSLF